jgi:murein DD-endopeptidase MepM/ murein hydrolase activator NlpD
LELTNREIENAAAEIALLDEKIEIKKREYEDALAEEERQMKIFKRRLRAMEENGTITYYEILFDASSFSDFLSRLDSISEIIKADELIIRKIERARLQLVLAQQEYWDSKDEQEAAKAALEAKKAELQKELDAADEYIRGIEADIAAYEADAEANRDKLAQIQAELEAQIAAQAALDEMIERLLREQRDINAGVYAKGSFLWPSADSKLVTSIYGMRLHPILGYTTMHNGIDIGAAYGTDIYASDGGIVIISEYSSSYGNYVMLNHGGGRYTLYAHMSKRLVEVDDAVSQGDVIGLVGSTGYSTGPHIHFEVYIDEKRVDPLQFFSNYTILD